MEILTGNLKAINKDLDHRTVIAETRAKDLEANRNDLNTQLAKTQGIQAQLTKELKETQAEAIIAGKEAQDTIKELDKQVTVSTERAAGLAEKQNSCPLQSEREFYDA